MLSTNGSGTLSWKENYQFKTIAVSGQSDVVAESDTDTLNLVPTNGVSITTNSGSDTLTFSTDLKSNGGLVIESTTELAVDLGASTITGTFNSHIGK